MPLEPFYVLLVVATGFSYRVDGGWDSCILEQQRLFPEVTMCQAYESGAAVGPPKLLPVKFMPRSKR